MRSHPHAVTRNPLLRFCVKQCPVGVKRIVLLSSFIAYVANTSNPEREFVRDMNKALNLTRGSDSSLDFPIRLSKVFWGEREIFREEIDVLTSDRPRIEKERAALRVAAMVPPWFAYGSIQEIATDLVNYFYSFPRARLAA